MALRDDASADPDLSLEFVRGQSPMLPAKPYGVLDLRVAPPPAAASALDAAHGLDPAAFVTPVIFRDGFLRMQVIAGATAIDQELVEELEQPVWFASNGLDSSRLVRRLTPDAAVLVRDAFGEGALTMSAVAEMTLRGLAERLPVRLSFDPRALLDALRVLGDDRSRVAVDAIVALWTRRGRRGACCRPAAWRTSSARDSHASSPTGPSRSSPHQSPQPGKTSSRPCSCCRLGPARTR